MPARKWKQESLLMGKKGLSGASQSKSILSICLFSSLCHWVEWNWAVKHAWRCGCPGMIVPVQWCASLGGVLTPWQQRLSRLLCACHSSHPRVYALFRNRGNCQFKSECSLAFALFGMLSSCWQWSPKGNCLPLHPLLMQILYYFVGLLLLTWRWESTSWMDLQPRLVITDAGTSFLWGCVTAAVMACGHKQDRFLGRQVLFIYLFIRSRSSWKKLAAFWAFELQFQIWTGVFKRPSNFSSYTNWSNNGYHFFFFLQFLPFLISQGLICISPTHPPMLEGELNEVQEWE